jgi:hypothetical protein
MEAWFSRFDGLPGVLGVLVRAMQNSDPLVRSGWIYGYDAEAAVRDAAV